GSTRDWSSDVCSSDLDPTRRRSLLLRAVMGLLRPVAGGVTFDGSDLTGRPPFEISNAGIAYVPQGREIFKDFTVEENLRLGLLGKTGMAARVPDAIYGRFPILAERRAQRAEIGRAHV